MKTSTMIRSAMATLLVAVLAVGATVWLNHGRDRAGDPADIGPVQTAGPFQIQVALDPDKPRVGKNRLLIVVRNATGKPVEGAVIDAVAVMPAMGSMPVMRAPAHVSEIAPGRYAGEFELPMDGAWPLSLSIESAALGRAELQFDLTTSRAGLRLTEATPGAGAAAPHTPAGDTQAKSAGVTQKDTLSGSIVVDARRRQLIGVTFGVVERKHLTQTIRAAGQVTYDETRLTDISLKFDGWIGELDADYVGIPVKKDQVLFSVYSPELVSAQDEYLESLRRHNSGADSLLAAARRRLSFWDLTPAQIGALEKRGHAAEYVSILSPAGGTVVKKTVVAGTAVKAGMQLLRIADLSRVWVEGQVYEYELSQVKVGMAATVVLPEMPGHTFAARVSYVYPYLERATRTARVRVELPNPDGLLRPDMYANLYLKVDLGERLVVPEAAVLYAGESRVVFLDLGDGHLQPLKIRTGLRNGDDIEVLEGVAAGDRVVTSGNFLIAAESKLKAGIEQW
jgi:Cu(I)/Ag(I) efflux system membrane fusion protein